MLFQVSDLKQIEDSNKINIYVTFAKSAIENNFWNYFETLKWSLYRVG